MVEQFREIFLRRSRKSIGRASLDTHIPPAIVWRVARKSVRLTVYMLQPVQALKTDEKQRCVNMQEKLEDESEERLVFSAVATYKNIYVQHSKCSHFTGGTKTEDI